jgi:hypothetical protein
MNILIFIDIDLAGESRIRLNIILKELSHVQIINMDLLIFVELNDYQIHVELVLGFYTPDYIYLNYAIIKSYNRLHLIVILHLFREIMP